MAYAFLRSGAARQEGAGGSMGDAPPLDEDAPDEALLAEDGRSSPTSVGRVRKRAQIGAQLARGWERGVAPSEGA